jgi:hypothetical protein
MPNSHQNQVLLKQLLQKCLKTGKLGFVLVAASNPEAGLGELDGTTPALVIREDLGFTQVLGTGSSPVVILTMQVKQLGGSK